MRFYATGTKKFEEQVGTEKVTTVKGVRIDLDPMVIKTRHQAVKEAAIIAKQQKITLDGIDGVCIDKSSMQDGKVMHKSLKKRIKDQREVELKRKRK